jgi:hypothetical protein
MGYIGSTGQRQLAEAALPQPYYRRPPESLCRSEFDKNTVQGESLEVTICLHTWREGIAREDCVRGRMVEEEQVGIPTMYALFFSSLTEFCK